MADIDWTLIERERFEFAEELAACLYEASERIDPGSHDGDGTWDRLAEFHKSFYAEMAILMLGKTEILQRAASLSNRYCIARGVKGTE